ncbi:hypothetical protein C8F01DRAFT_1265477 [Mycena amicta]|nr:hypothetical protein C8F01DRAFT_1265477 [Mycena amicta]
MPSRPKASQTRLDSVASKLTVTLETLDVLVDGFKSPFLEPVCLATRSILTAVQTAKGNKNDYIDVLDGVNQLLSAVIALHITSDAGTELRPSFLQEMGHFVKTLHKVFSLLETQQETSRIKLLFRQGELSTMLQECKADLADILESLKASLFCLRIFCVAYRLPQLQAAGLVDAMHDLQVDMDKTRQHILELLPRSFSSRSYSASSVLSLLPSIPKIFHGREHHLAHIIDAFRTNDSPRIAILGPGGIGKTSLARAVLHHPDIVLRYRSQQEQQSQCFFVPCDTALAAQDLLTLVGSHLGLKSGRNLRREIASRLGDGGSHLLVLDNVETVWEPVDWREEVEEILAFLADIPRLAILITMRGAERPTRIHWTRPFLPPLEPLTQDAARQTFLDITDESLATEGTLDAILRLTDNLPLAITLMAHLVDSEGFASVLTRWDEEKTALFSDGFDKRSNLDMSIAMSLSSPRLRSNPHAVDLLSLLSVLPDGLSEGDLLQQNHLPIENILECKTALLRTSLAYISSSQRLNLLVPIREYVRQHHSPRNALVQPVFRAYLEVLELSKNYYGLVPSGDLLAHIGANFANIQTLLPYNLQRVDVDGLDAESLVRCAISANMYSRAAGKGEIPFFGQLVAKGRFEQLGVGGMLEVHFLAERLSAYYYKLVSDGPALIERAIALFPTFDDPKTKCLLYNCASNWYRNRSNLDKAKIYTEMALGLSTGDTRLQCGALSALSMIQLRSGNPQAALLHADTAQTYAQAGGDLFAEATALRDGVLCLSELGVYGEAIERGTRARTLLAVCDVPGGEMDMSLLVSLAELYRLKSEYVEAHAAYQEILHYRPLDQASGMHVVVLLNVAEIEIALGFPSVDVQSRVDLARQIAGSMRWKLGGLMCDSLQGEVLLSQAKYGDAKLVLETCVADSCAGNELDVQSFCLERLADLDLWDAASWNAEWPVLLLAQASKVKQKRLLYRSIQCIGNATFVDGDMVAARSLFLVALDGFTQLDIHRSRGECLVKLGQIAAEAGNRVAAKEMWTTARLLLERSSQREKVLALDTNLASFELESSEPQSWCIERRITDILECDHA